MISIKHFQAEHGQNFWAAQAFLCGAALPLGEGAFAATSFRSAPGPQSLNFLSPSSKSSIEAEGEEVAQLTTPTFIFVPNDTSG